MREGLAAQDLGAVAVAFRDLLRSHQGRLNRLNVYPVPDGDTGTNMALTMESVVAELERLGPGADMAETCQAIGHGALMGGRGNSGVILSQLLRGMTGRCAPHQAVGPLAVAEALVAAASSAYEAVSRPVEGTILTVAREAAEAAMSAERDGADLTGVLDAARAVGGESLARTPELLPVLAAAGVVDAGGAGFLLLLDAALHVVAGRELPAPEGLDDADPEAVSGAAHALVADEPRYEVMYFLEADDALVPAFKHAWAAVGDSIVVVGGDGLWNCHIHTDDIGAAIETALDAGRPRAIRVTDLHEQVEEEAWVRAASVGGDSATATVRCAVVAVGAGDGIHRLLRSLGAQTVVAGGQSMNPSVAELLQAVTEARADEVVLLPNNKNIVPVARQVAELSSKPVVVVPTRGVAEGIASLVAYDPARAAADNGSAMELAIADVVAGEVTRAVRDATSEAGPIAEGDFLGIARNGIRVVERELTDAVCRLLEELLTDDHELVTLIEGDGAGGEATRSVTAWLAERRPDLEVEVHDGGQPLYPYLLAVE